MTWLGLAHHVHALRARALSLPSLPSEPRAAAELAVREHGLELVRSVPTLINIAALALAMHDRLVVHEVRPPVPDLVDATDLHSLPPAPPHLLAGPCLLEVRRPGPEALFGEPGFRTCSLGCYELDGSRYLVGLQHPDGARVVRWQPTWHGGDLGAGVVHEGDGPMLEGIDPGEHHAWGVQAARFLLVLGLLLDAASSPTRTVDDPPRPRATRRHGEVQPARPWAVRRVYLEGRGGGGEARDEATAGAPRDGAEAVTAAVRGHLKRQPHGPGGSLRRWIALLFGHHHAQRPRRHPPARLVARDGPGLRAPATARAPGATRAWRRDGGQTAPTRASPRLPCAPDGVDRVSRSRHAPGRF